MQLHHLWVRVPWREHRSLSSIFCIVVTENSGLVWSIWMLKVYGHDHPVLLNWWLLPLLWAAFPKSLLCTWGSGLQLLTQEMMSCQNQPSSLCREIFVCLCLHILGLHRQVQGLGLWIFLVWSIRALLMGIRGLCCLSPGEFQQQPLLCCERRQGAHNILTFRINQRIFSRMQQFKWSVYSSLDHKNVYFWQNEVYLFFSASFNAIPSTEVRVMKCSCLWLFYLSATPLL